MTFVGVVALVGIIALGSATIPRGVPRGLIPRLLCGVNSLHSLKKYKS
jgi:hypothetical protein